jgi:putative Mn2+ efflux pump MntP
MGIGAGITGMSVFITPLVCGIASFVFIKGGSSLGNLIHKGKFSKYLEIISAILVFALGILGFYN